MLSCVAAIVSKQTRAISISDVVFQVGEKEASFPIGLAVLDLLVVRSMKSSLDRLTTVERPAESGLLGRWLRKAVLGRQNK